jgi:hypothetical protein
MNIGNGSTKRVRPRQAFEAYKDNNSKKIDFGESSLSTAGVYRRKWSDGKSWFGTIVKLTILVTILTAIIIGVITELLR